MLCCCPDTIRNLTDVNEQQAKLVVKLEGEVANGKEKQAEVQVGFGLDYRE